MAKKKKVGRKKGTRFEEGYKDAYYVSLKERERMARAFEETFRKEYSIKQMTDINWVDRMLK